MKHSKSKNWFCNFAEYVFNPSKGKNCAVCILFIIRNLFLNLGFQNSYPQNPLQFNGRRSWKFIDDHACKCNYRYSAFGLARCKIWQQNSYANRKCSVFTLAFFFELGIFNLWNLHFVGRIFHCDANHQYRDQYTVNCGSTEIWKENYWVISRRLEHWWNFRRSLFNHYAELWYFNFLAFFIRHRFWFAPHRFYVSDAH